MPYITQKRRDIIDDGENPTNAGEIQYLFATVIKDYLDEIDDYSYQDLNDILGAISGCQMEFYREVVVPYEQQKIKLNGGIY